MGDAHQISHDFEAQYRKKSQAIRPTKALPNA
jgi:hypothetical protein